MSTAAIRPDAGDARKRLGQVFTPRPVADWMAEPRVGVRYFSVYPGDEGWDS